MIVWTPCRIYGGFWLNRDPLPRLFGPFLVRGKVRFRPWSMSIACLASLTWCICSPLLPISLPWLGANWVTCCIMLISSMCYDTLGRFSKRWFWRPSQAAISICVVDCGPPSWRPFAATVLSEKSIALCLVGINTVSFAGLGNLFKYYLFYLLRRAWPLNLSSAESLKNWPAVYYYLWFAMISSGNAIIL